MLSGVVETLLKIIAVILTGIIGYNSGKKSVESDLKDKAISDVEKRRKIEQDIINANPDTIKRMSEHWTTRE